MNQNKKNRIYYFACLFIVLIASACSTENYSFVSKKYHATTTKFNGYFNANELLNNSLITFRENYKENYYQILPTEVFPKKQEEIKTFNLRSVYLKKTNPTIWHPYGCRKY